MPDQANTPFQQQYAPPEQQQAPGVQTQPPSQAWQQPQSAVKQQQVNWQNPQAQQAAWQQPPATSPYMQQPGFPMNAPAPTPQKQKNGKAIAALVLGILAIVISGPFIGIILGGIAIALAIASRSTSRDGKATAGLVCGIAGLVLSLFMTIGFVLVMNDVIDNPLDASSEPTEEPSTLAEDVKGKVIADDDVCIMTISRLEFDAEGNLNVYFTLTDNVVHELVLSNSSDDSWEVNGELVDCVCYTWVDPDETKEDCFTIPAEYLDTNNLEDIESIVGTVEADIGTGYPMVYDVVLT